MVWLTVAYSGADRLTVAYNDDLSESITPIMYVVRGSAWDRQAVATKAPL